jgi:lipoprotein-releasing system ATP-binding protein
MSSETVIQCRGVDKVYGIGRKALRVLKTIDLDVERGEVLSIVGPSGAGKSTLLNIIGCLDTRSSGEVQILGKNVSSLSVERMAGFRNRNIGFIFQLHHLMPEFSALENVAMPLMIRRVPFSQARKQALDLLESFGLMDRVDHKPGELSGGECQRVTVARAMAGEPEILLADEPTGSLDSENSMNLMGHILEIARSRKTTVCLVTHDREIASMADRLLRLRDGAIVHN